MNAAAWYWTARNLPLPPVIVRLAHLDGADGLAELGGPYIWFDVRLFDSATRKRRDKLIQQLTRRYFCDVAVHEAGHSVGLTDGDPTYSIMDTSELPWECRVAFPVPKDA